VLEPDIHDSRISQNVASAAGGGLVNNGIMAIEARTIDHNRTRSGGSMNHFGATCT
jgi:hypothetical protein